MLITFKGENKAGNRVKECLVSCVQFDTGQPGRRLN